jgi:N-acyl-D-amino-acid deacylase
MHDLVIRGATVVDGTGAPPVRADVGVRDGRIAEVRENIAGSGHATVVDAGGLTLAPGFIDVHTHYDAQVTWDPTLSPSSSLGVTSVVMGNCGFGIAPCQPPVNDILMKNLSVVEGMNLDALRAGIRWEFQTFGEYQEFLRKNRPYLNVATLIGHSAVRSAVMGDAGSEVKVPSVEQLAQMRELVREALRNGAIGFASSWSPNHSGYNGVPMPSTIAGEGEVRSLVGVLGEEKRGVFQMAAGSKEVAFFESLAAATARPVFMSTNYLLHNEAAPGRALAVLDACSEATRRGHAVNGHVTCQPLSMDFSPDDAFPLFASKAFDRVRNAPLAEKPAVYASREFRDAWRASLKDVSTAGIFTGNWARLMVSTPALARNAALENRSIAEIAKERGQDPLDVFCDLAVEEDLKTIFVIHAFNVNEDGVAPLLKHDACVIALSDAGAHLSFLCDAGYGPYFLGRWVRERGEFGLAEGVRRLTSHQADLYGIADRGRIVQGAFADLVLFDPATVGISKCVRRHDLPGGQMRTIREPRGIEGTWVNGVRIQDARIPEASGIVPMHSGPGMVLDRFN